MKIKTTLGISLLTCLISAFFSNGIYAQTTIQHKTGAYYTDYMPNGMQKTHEYPEVVYVNPSAGSVTLTLPSTGTVSPHHYFRWYNYQDDSLSPRINPVGTRYTNGYAVYGGNSRINSVTYNLQGTTFPDIIACDVSSYTDYTIANNLISVEPTLSYRSIFEIRDGNEIATQLQQLTAAGEYLQESTVYMPANPASTHQRHRVTLEHDQSNYFGYDGTGTLMRGTLGFSGGNYYSFSNPFIFINPGAAGTTGVVTVRLTVGSGANQRIYNVARFNIEFIADSPQEFTTTGYRSVEYMNANYYLLGSLDFDYDTRPATAANNMWSTPLPYEICEYGFVSETLYNLGYRGFNNKVSQWNEYGFYKTANVSLPGLTGYTWYNGGKQVYDRRYYQTNGAEQGYFMYIDAAESPGVIAKIPIAELCAGTKLFVSGAIASLTQNNAASFPNVNAVFYGFDSEGNQVELSRYTSGDIPSNTSNEPTPWYQLYYSFTFEGNTDYVSYILQLENNCTGTNGGDYAIDDLRIYRSKPSVQSYQLELLCGQETAKVKVRVEFEKLLSAMGLTEVETGDGETSVLKYKILDANQNPINYNYGTGENPNYEYGEIGFSTNFSEMTPLETGQDPPVATGDPNIIAYTETEILDNIEYRYLVFLVPNTGNLSSNVPYYAVVADGEEDFDTGTCALISDPFTIIPSNTVTVDGIPWVQSDGLCFGNTMTIGAYLRERTDAFTEIEALFDWYFGTFSEFQEAVPGFSYSAQYALIIYRLYFPNPDEGDGLSTNYQGDYTPEIHDLLQQEINEGKIVLNSKSVTLVIREADVILAIPLIQTAEISGDVDINDLCNDMLTINTSGPANNPTIQLGNEYFRNVRMGLLQLNDLQEDSSKTLTIPVSDYRSSDGTKSRFLTAATDRTVYLVYTNDGNISVDPLDETTFINVAEVASVNVNNTANDNIVFNIPSGSAFNPREGYIYTLEFHFNETTAVSQPPACDGTGTFTIKLVPEYLTWTGTEGDNWNNDNNWRRSTADELYKTDYIDDPDSNGFVPMDFSKAVIPVVDGVQTLNSPWLYRLTGSPFLNMDNTNYTDDADKIANAATDSIEYDLMVTTAGTNYSTVNFYGNTADQVYFKPMAEMRGTNFLDYTKAHVDFEINAGRWYMLASPLKNVVAGDMYLPTATGRQETEAFEPITFNTDINNRFNPAVYQRSWDHANSTVFRQDGSTEDAFIASEWSQVYNKVDELYTPGTGFSINTHLEAGETGQVLFRLPKDDTAFLYYTYDGQFTGNSTPISRTDNGRLAFENETANVTVPLANQSVGNDIFLVGNPFIATLNMSTFFEQNTDFESRYWIITAGGMSGVQINSDGSITATGDEIMGAEVVPMQAFFIEKTDGTNTSQVIFTPEMTVKPTGLTLRSQKVENETIRIKAERNGLSSNILIQKKDGANNGYDPKEDMRVIMDSNLADVPTVYSMAGNQATMINVLNEWEGSIPLGIYSNSEEEVTLTFEGLNTLSNHVYLLNNLDGDIVELSENENVVTLPGNTFGQYSLSFNLEKNNGNSSNSIYVYSTYQGYINVQTIYPEVIQKIRVYAMDGTLIREISGENSLNVAIDLPSAQVYIINVTSNLGNLVQKIYCR